MPRIFPPSQPVQARLPIPRSEPQLVPRFAPQLLTLGNRTTPFAMGSFPGGLRSMAGPGATMNLSRSLPASTPPPEPAPDYDAKHAVAIPPPDYDGAPLHSALRGNTPRSGTRTRSVEIAEGPAKVRRVPSLDRTAETKRSPVATLRQFLDEGGAAAARRGDFGPGELSQFWSMAMAVDRVWDALPGGVQQQVSKVVLHDEQFREQRRGTSLPDGPRAPRLGVKPSLPDAGHLEAALRRAGFSGDGQR